jgi:CubicO group peptidase (beta-lactamase class C family)
MKLINLAIAGVILVGSSALASTETTDSAGVTYHTPNLEMEKNLNRYGTGVANWEEGQFLQFTVADAHLFHHYALVKHGEPMPLILKGGLDISTILVDDVIPGKKITLYDLMRDRASIDSYVVMNKNGEILAEDYWNGTTPETKHHIMSAHKSFTSMLAFIAQEKGLFKTSDPIGKYISEFKGTKWETVPIQNFMDMTSGIQNLPESRKGYHNWGMPEGELGWDSSMATSVGYSGLRKVNGKLVPIADSQGDLENFSDYLKVFAKQIEPSFKPGEAYLYRCVNTEIFGAVIPRTSGMTYAEFMQKNLWSRGGFNYDMTLFVNQEHENAAAGSMNCTIRDLAIGSFLMVNGGKNWKGEEVLPEAYIKEVLEGDAVVKAAWSKASYEYKLVPDAFYKNQWRTITDPNTGRKMSMMIGVNGQYSVFDHKTGNIIATQGSYRAPTGQAYVELYMFDIISRIFDELEKK